MPYKLTFQDGSSAYLAHYGVLGMHWGKWNAETAARYNKHGAKGAKHLAKAEKLEEKYNLQRELGKPQKTLDKTMNRVVNEHKKVDEYTKQHREKIEKKQAANDRRIARSQEAVEKRAETYLKNPTDTNRSFLQQAAERQVLLTDKRTQDMYKSVLKKGPVLSLLLDYDKLNKDSEHMYQQVEKVMNETLVDVKKKKGHKDGKTAAVRVVNDAHHRSNYQTQQAHQFQQQAHRFHQQAVQTAVNANSIANYGHPVM